MIVIYANTAANPSTSLPSTSIVPERLHEEAHLWRGEYEEAEAELRFIFENETIWINLGSLGFADFDTGFIFNFEATVCQMFANLMVVQGEVTVAVFPWGNDRVLTCIFSKWVASTSNY